MKYSAGILLIEDHPLMRNGIKSLISDADGFHVVAEAASLAEAEPLLNLPSIQIVLLDLTLPDGTGLDFLPRITALRPDVRVVILTMHNESPYLSHTIELGACAYVVKDMAPERLIEALRGVQRGEKLFFASSTSAQPALKVESLSPREERVKDLLLRGRSLTQIAAELGLSVKTVFTYRVRLLKKLGLKSHSDLIGQFASAPMSSKINENSQ